MRKNLHYKILASVLAIAGLYFYNAPAAWADDFTHVENTPNTWIGNGEINGNSQIPDTASVYGWHSTYDTYGDNANENKITINNSTLAQVKGAYSNSSNTNNNVVTINNSNIQDIYGGESEYGTASGNEVLITNTEENTAKEFDIIIGGSTGSGEATSNTVTINGNITVDLYIAGGFGSSNRTVML